MKQTKYLSRILYYISRLIAIGYGGTVLYALFCLITGLGTSAYGEGKYLHIHYPFTEKPFLNVDNNLPYMLFSFLVPLSLYSLFFGLASNVFRVFYRPKLFTAQNIIHLKRFYGLNLFAPITCVLTAVFFVEVESVIWAMVLVHFILGIFTYFLAAIFRQGLHLQHEQDLFI